MKVKVKFFEDAGHGWYRVLDSVVDKLPLAVSAYSYISPSGKYAYLEEDDDADSFFKYVDRCGWEVEMSTAKYHVHSPIRRYKRYTEDWG